MNSLSCTQFVQPALPVTSTFCSSIPDYETFYRYGLQKTSCSQRTATIRIHAQRNHVFPWIGKKPMDRIASELILEVIQDMRKHHLSSTMVNAVFQEIKRTFRLAVKEHVRSDNPCDGIQCSRNQTCISSDYPFTLQDLKNLQEAFRKIPLHNLFCFCFYTGTPFSTARVMKRKDVDINHQKCVISTGRLKGELFLSDNVFQYVASEYQGHADHSSEDDFLFLSKDGRPVSRRYMQTNLHMLRILLNNNWLSLPQITRAIHISEGSAHDQY